MRTQRNRNTGIIGAILLSALLTCTAGPTRAGTTAYQYDALGRLIKVTYPDSKQICYSYDSAGNRTQVKRQATGTCTVTGSTLTSSLVAQTTSLTTTDTKAQATNTIVTITSEQVATDSATTETTYISPTN